MDPYWVQQRRIWYAVALRGVLMGTPNPPCWGDLHRSAWFVCTRTSQRRRAYCREVHWAWTIKWFTHRGYFAIRELFDRAREVVRLRGRPFSPSNIEEDTVLLKAWTGDLKKVLHRERWRFDKSRTRKWVEDGIRRGIEQRTQLDLIRGICPLCGQHGLPCVDCGVPAVVRGPFGKPVAVTA